MTFSHRPGSDAQALDEAGVSADLRLQSQIALKHR
jgi:hypothetical protein